MDEDGGRAVERREFLAALAWTVFGAAQARSESAPRTSGKTVDTLRRISLERRAALDAQCRGPDARRAPAADPRDRRGRGLERRVPRAPGQDPARSWPGTWSAAATGKAASASSGRRRRCATRTSSCWERWTWAWRGRRNAHTTRELADGPGHELRVRRRVPRADGRRARGAEALPGRERVGIPRQRDPLAVSAAERADAALPRDREVVRRARGPTKAEKVQKRLGGRMALFATVRPGPRRDHRRHAPRELGQGQRRRGRSRRGCSSTRCAPTRRTRR